MTETQFKQIMAFGYTRGQISFLFHWRGGKYEVELCVDNDDLAGEDTSGRGDTPMEACDEAVRNFIERMQG